VQCRGEGLFENSNSTSTHLVCFISLSIVGLPERGERYEFNYKSAIESTGLEIPCNWLIILHTQKQREREKYFNIEFSPQELSHELRDETF
jgi:hypothetical protein